MNNKNIKIALSLCLASALCVNCNDNSLSESEVIGKSFHSISAQLPYELTRLDYSEDGSSLDLNINWNDNDEIAVFSATKQNNTRSKFILKTGAGTKHGEFDWSAQSADENEPFFTNGYNMFAVYPFEKSTTNKNGLNKINISVSSTSVPVQLINNDYSHLAQHDIMLSKVMIDETETPSLVFKPMMSILTVKYHGLEPGTKATSFLLNIKNKTAFYKSRQLVMYALGEGDVADFAEQSAAYWSTTALNEVQKIYLHFGENCVADGDGNLTVHMPIIPTDKVQGQAMKFVFEFTTPDTNTVTKSFTVSDFPVNFESGKHYVKNFTLN